MSFVAYIVSHNSTDLCFNIVFDNPDKMSIGGARMIIEIKETSIFKSQITLKAINGGYFEVELPPQVPDPEKAKYLESLSDKIVGVIENCIRSNFIVLIILGSAMASFWGMIRAVQLITYSAT